MCKQVTQLCYVCESVIKIQSRHTPLKTEWPPLHRSTPSPLKIPIKCTSTCSTTDRLINLLLLSCRTLLSSKNTCGGCGDGDLKGGDGVQGRCDGIEGQSACEKHYIIYTLERQTHNKNINNYRVCSMFINQPIDLCIHACGRYTAMLVCCIHTQVHTHIHFFIRNAHIYIYII